MPLPLEARVEPALLRLARGEIQAGEIAGLRRSAAGLAVIRIEAFRDRDASRVASRVRTLAEPAEPSLARGPPDLFVVRGSEILAVLANVPGVSYIEAVREREHDDNLAVKGYILDVEPVWTAPSLGYDGTGVIVDHNDSGVDLSHADFPPGTVLANGGRDGGHGQRPRDPYGRRLNLRGRSKVRREVRSDSSSRRRRARSVPV